MSDKELDNLFNKKLEGFQASPSPEAWKNIEAGIRPGGINWKFYITIAASLLLVAVIAFLMVRPTNESELFTDSEKGSTEEGFTLEQPVTSNETLATMQETPAESPQEINERKKAVVQSTVTEQTSVAEQVPEKETKKDPAVSTKLIEVAQEPLIAKNTQTEPEGEVEKAQQAETDKATDAIARLEAVQPLEESTGTETSTPVVFTGEKVEIAAAETVPEESQRGFSLKKVVEMARDFKTDNDSWSSLREAKNELLTLGRKKNDSSDD